MKEATDFYYDGKYSIDMGLINCNVSTGLLEEPFLAEKDIMEISIRGNDKPYFQGVKKSPLILNLSFAFIDRWDEQKIREVARWLNQDYYKPFYTTSNTNRIFYCMYTGSMELLHNGLKQGYINLQMRCNSPYSYSPTYISPVYDYSSNPIEGSILKFTNLGDIDLYPEISITKVGNGDISIINQTNGNQEFKFIGLIDGEEIYVNCEQEIIETNLPTEYRYSSFNDNYLCLKYGVNSLLVKGNCKLQFRYQYAFLNG